MYQRIRDLREDRDLTQGKIAAILHVSQATYSRYESGSLELPIAALLTLAEFYNTSTDYILERTDDSTPPVKPQPKKDA